MQAMLNIRCFQFNRDLNYVDASSLTPRCRYYFNKNATRISLVICPIHFPCNLILFIKRTKGFLTGKLRIGKSRHSPKQPVENVK